MKKEKWEKCFKINCTPPLEVYENHINFFGENIDIEDIEQRVESIERKTEFLKEAKSIWKKEFSNK